MGVSVHADYPHIWREDNMNKPKVGVASNLDKISEVIDIDGNKLSGIKGHIIERKKVFNMADLEVNENAVNTPNEVKPNSLAEKIEKKINDKINEMLDKKIDEIFSKIF